MTKTLTRLLGLLGATTVLLLTGCSAGSLPGGTIPDMGPMAPSEVVDDAPSVVITGSIAILTDDPLDAAAQATSIVQAAGGRVDGRTERSANRWEGARAELALRIPAARVDEVRAQLATLGDVDHTQLQSVEVGETQRDLEARIRTLRISIDRYNSWLEQAASIDDLISLETAISQRQSTLESLEAQQRSLADQVAMSRIDLTLRSTVTAADPAPSNFGEAFVRGWHQFFVFWANALIVLGYAFPWLLFLAGLTVLIVWLARRGRRRAPAIPAQASPYPSHPQQPTGPPPN